MYRKQPAPPAKGAPAAAPQKTAQVTPKQTSAPTPAPKKPAEKKPEVKLDVDAAFTALDKEGVGYLVLEKVRPALRRKGYTTRFIEHLFCHLGPDLKGRVTQAQFQDALKCLPKGIFG